MLELTQTHYIAILNFLAVIIVASINIRSNKKHNAKTVLKDLLSEKVDKLVCDPAMKRVGKAIDEIKEDCKTQNKVVTEQGKSMAGIEQGMGFIIGRMNGDWDSIKNTGLNLG